MNRQVRRIEEKKERKQERDKAKAKAEKQARRRERAAARSRASARSKADDAGAKEHGESGGETKAPRARGRDPGRFSGALTVASLFFIALQAMTPMGDDVVPQLVAATYYLLFGYFAVMWLLRRGSDRPIALAVGVGVALGAATGANQWLQPGLEPAPLLLALFAPLLVGGAFLGRVVFRNAPG